MKIKHWQTLEYCDGILLFVGITPCRVQTLAVMVEWPNMFLVVPLTDEQRQKLMDGAIELREMFANPVPAAWFIANIDDWENIELKPIERTQIPDDWLPGEGCFL